MKNFTLLLAILLLSLSVFSKQTVISSGQVLSASTLYTNDHESMTAAQTVVNVGLCNDGSSYTVPSLHASTTIDGYGYTFQPGYTYTVQVTGSATAACTVLISAPGPRPL